MEDRQPTGLALEMISAPEGTGSAEAARWQREVAIPAALATRAFSRAAAFSNLRPGEKRFPRKLPEPSHLTVYETSAPDPLSAFRAAAASLPAPPASLRVERKIYRRYPRASQGRLTGRPTRGIFLILISPRDRARAQALRDWADFVHIHYIAAATPPGFTMITPYENAEGKDPLFMHFYELDADDPIAAVDGMTPAVCRYHGFAMGDEAFRAWAVTPDLDIHYVNVFGRIETSSGAA